MTPDQTSGCLQNRPAVPDSVVSATVGIWRDSGEQHWVIIEGQSMLPLIKHGDRVLIRFGMTDIAPGSVIVFQRNGALIAHRVLRVCEGSVRKYVTKGDNTLGFDSLVAEGDVLGRVLAVEQDGSRISLDTVRWDASGRIIASTSVLFAAIFSRARRLKQSMFGTSPVIGEKLPQKCARTATSIAMRVAILFSETKR